MKPPDRLIVDGGRLIFVLMRWMNAGQPVVNKNQILDLVNDLQTLFSSRVSLACYSCVCRSSVVAAELDALTLLQHPTRGSTFYPFVLVQILSFLPPLPPLC